ncbi:MAG TPA: dihydrofolate reductase family protein [Actinoplanes sp.]|nr:dihydrofolate reductase family protein [Actinoplanes sp.]
MGKLIYTGITSLDGYTVDREGKFDWAEPPEDVHRFINDLEEPISTYLYGRRMYQTMIYWETAHTVPGQPPFVLDYARVWQAADKIVYSTTLESASSANTRLERHFDPDAVRQFKDSATADLSISGPDLAAHAIRAGLIDEYRQFLHPIVVGGGQPFLPADVRLNLELIDERRFTGGVVYLCYRALDRDIRRQH